ncbi:MAG: methylated-DNA--[protein]-cysteine S-methyltransferase [Clostridia bacterium]|nr:methylated-DNA--[protein]-cysteine S-methyltransferase [Clostridia bacterium]
MEKKTYMCFWESPIGTLQLAEQDGSLTHLLFAWHNTLADLGIDAEERETPFLKEAEKQLQEYFDGKRTAFDLPLAPKGTAFQQKCWEGLRTIPYGETRTYKDIAAYAGNPKAVRAAGGANHNNPISIIVPCHRVVGSGGSLTGFGGGLEAKAFLLNLEQKGAGGSKVWEAK